MRMQKKIVVVLMAVALTVDDPYLISRLAAAAVRGFQGEGDNIPYKKGNLHGQTLRILHCRQ